jgi:hypothetical protein
MQWLYCGEALHPNGVRRGAPKSLGGGQVDMRKIRVVAAYRIAENRKIENMVLVHDTSLRRASAGLFR